jgi:hypothetical protein
MGGIEKETRIPRLISIVKKGNGIRPKASKVVSVDCTVGTSITE